MKASNINRIIVFLLSAALIVATSAFQPVLPVTGSSFSTADSPFQLAEADDTRQTSAALNAFVSSVTDGNAKALRGVYADGVLALPIVEQPSNQAAFVSTTDGVATRFAMAGKYNTVGLLAHNYLAGRYFFNLNVGDTIELVYGDGSVKSYTVTAFYRFQALSPTSANSKFRDLETDKVISATELFKKVYMGNHHLTLQTCIQQGSVDSWGRLFVIAEPVAAAT